MRSGSAHCHVCLSKERIGSPLISHPDVLIAMNEISLRKFAPHVASEGLILYNSDTLPADLDLPPARVVSIPASGIADKLGSTKAANVVLLGALVEETDWLAPQTALAAIEDQLRKPALLDINRKALEAGRHFIEQNVWVGAETQPDGFAY
jgi:Pyruvate/2-oxoacid:ferredoxin oxidoreductase gamma subunit